MKKKRLGQTNALVKKCIYKNQRPDIDKIHLYVKDPFKKTYQLLINWWENIEIKRIKNPKAFTLYSQTIDDFYENIEDVNPTKKRKVLVLFDDMIADIKAEKKLSVFVTELFLSGRKLNILFVFKSEFYSKMPKTIRLSATYEKENFSIK